MSFQVQRGVLFDLQMSVSVQKSESYLQDSVDVLDVPTAFDNYVYKIQPQINS